ncbi:hypothetical protein IGI04_024221 [Brassica rapa subsp. trilocularis]|uniref:FBD domain-containing protein n=1 Tax=Brassica rapa subsp. trilocularis TaxID=1813537 RepID=A0ABQ7LZ08_BRACM|nr:hypothetical protein IGI04_032140 [Brassica rapa subsp. trilocularis]KAG5394258.1 hypothetical protein IGI04_024221 [Brassica rapa subsp. trilocularis]
MRFCIPGNLRICIPTLVILSQTMHLEYLQVATSSHDMVTKTNLLVLYKLMHIYEIFGLFRISRFIVGVNKNMEAIKHIFSLGIRFRMRFKGEESPERMVRFQELEIYLHNCQLLNGDHCNYRFPIQDCLFLFRSNGMSQQQSRDPAESCHLPLFQRLLNNHNQSARDQDQSNHPEKQLKNTYGVPSWQEPITPSAANEPQQKLTT